MRKSRQENNNYGDCEEGYGTYAETPAKYLFCSQDFHFDQSSLGQLLNSYRRAGREWSGEILRIDLVHCSEIIHIIQIDRCLDDVAEIGTCSLQDVSSVYNGLTRLLLDSALNKVARLRVDGNLTGGKDETVNLNSLTIRADCCRSIVCVNCFHCCLLLLLYK